MDHGPSASDLQEGGGLANQSITVVECAGHIWGGVPIFPRTIFLPVTPLPRLSLCIAQPTHGNPQILLPWYDPVMEVATYTHERSDVCLDHDKPENDNGPDGAPSLSVHHSKPDMPLPEGTASEIDPHTPATIQPATNSLPHRRWDCDDVTFGSYKNKVLPVYSAPRGTTADKMKTKDYSDIERQLGGGVRHSIYPPSRSYDDGSEGSYSSDEERPIRRTRAYPRDSPYRPPGPAPEDCRMDEKAAREKEGKEMAIDAEKHFTRKEGIIYVDSDEKWDALYDYAINCHLFISNPTTNSQVNTLDDSTEEATTYSTPSLIKINNRLLLGEMSGILDFEMYLRHDSPPFRCLVLFEQQFRDALAQKEIAFELLSLTHPTHPAVLRTESYLPHEFANLSRGTSSSPEFLSIVQEFQFNRVGPSIPLDLVGRESDGPKPGESTVLDQVDIARATLDGFRALVLCLNTDLRDLVALSRRMQLGRLDDGVPKLPFSHLWYLFTPGREVVSSHTRLGVFRVLNAVGGRRKSLVLKKGSLKPPQTLSDLVVDCFWIDFDGRRFGPVGVTFQIRPYEGVLPVTDLEIFPLIFAERSVEDRLVERGVKFEGLSGVSHRKYQGYNIRDGKHFDAWEEVRQQKFHPP